jgi:uncharacterized membrane-anchored protein
MKKYKWAIIIVNLILLLVYFNYSAFQKEKILKEGKLILLELAPVDPRSLMQGDYMDLRYKVSETDYSDSIPKRGYCIVKLDSIGVAKRVRFQETLSSLPKGYYAIEYTRSNNWRVNIGAESYFFQEGKSAKHGKAKYGGIKVDGSGNSLLIGLFSNPNQKIE